MPEGREGETILQVKDLVKHYPIRGGVLLRKKGSVRAVDGVSITVHEAETLGLVGESGCGKTTLGKAILRLEEPTSGSILFQGRDILTCSKRELRGVRATMQMIFQDPFSSLNPRKTVARIVGDPLLIHGMRDRSLREARVLQLLEVVGLNREHLRRYPHQFSGGQRQRIGIARALALKPKLIVCDEAVSALDVSIQAQVINLLKDLQDEFGLTYVFISHDLSVVWHMSDRMAVMYLGKIVEVAASREICTQPLHPYTQALLSACPTPDLEVKSRRIILKGDVPSPIDPPPGCRFHTRCMYVEGICRLEEPLLDEVKSGHQVACFFAGSVGLENR